MKFFLFQLNGMFQIDLILNQVLQLKKEVEDRIHLHKNLEQLYEGKLKSTQKQLEASSLKNEEYEKMVKYLRKKSAADKDALVKVKYNT